MSDFFEDRMRSALAKEIAVQSGAIVSGLATNYEDYRYRIGRIEGLKTAVSIADETHKMMYEGDKKK